jgi:high-affinity nickel-transport protein
MIFWAGITGSKRRIVVLFAVLATFNIAAWCWALLALHGSPALLGIALLVYGLGLRHAVDADHIAAIDNVTRKFVRMNVPSEGVGFSFAMGHSAIITLVAAAVACAVTTLDHIQSFQRIGGLISTGVSALFLLAIAVLNLLVFASTYRTFRRVRGGGTYVEEDLDVLLGNGGLLTRIFRPLFGLVTRDWHMFALGLLFGLSFDTATEVTMFGVSATQAAKGVSFWSVLVFPALFAAGMSLIDSADGVLMQGAYRWALIRPLRKLYYNMAITLASASVAILVGAIETLALLRERYDLAGGAWPIVDILSHNFNRLGFAIIGLFAIAWAVSFLMYKIPRGSEAEPLIPD